ncbi:SPO22-domain-containing protein [Bimuria novae-zelandiae CBS 107.79]|uniref:Protein ZIP4 homolog n=1 Tax=Bimuria novae-zelandiae CBS 107.79 TaxID=1447943 RepID=A0A6A5VQS6_9PLEO|nr:SPO22-domain-containing protein [Bimuria novae-zelandiae CBS 107.79]
MAPLRPTARAEREKSVKSVLSFALSLAERFEGSHDRALADDLQAQICSLPLSASSALTAKQNEFERLGTSLWNLATRLRRDEDQPDGSVTEQAARKNRALGLLRVFSFLLLDSAGSQSTKGQKRKNCIRLMKIALKAAKWCIQNKKVEDATKVLERAAEYQEVLSAEGENDDGAESELGERLRVEYFALRTALAWRSDRMDTAEYMFAKCKQLSRFVTASAAEDIADLLYEMGKDLSARHNYESAIQWLERAHDILGEQNFEMLGAEAGELRLSIMQNIVQAYMKFKTEESRTKAWHMLQLLEVDYKDKMSISLLKLEMLFSESTVDTDQVYLTLHRMIRTIVLNERNFKNVMHQIHKLKDHNNVTACKLLDILIETRLFREEKDAWIEKAVITRVWISCITFIAEGAMEQVRELFDMVHRNVKTAFSAQATHAAQTLLWKQVEANFSQGQHQEAESWCGICLHSLFDKAGEINKSKIASRKMILCALARHDYPAAREIFSNMSDPSREDRLTRYLMYKVALYENNSDLAVECLDSVCRQSSKDTTLLYACVVEAQQSGNKQQGMVALEKLLEKYNGSALADVHLPALLRMTLRLLMSELIKDGSLDRDIFEQICKTFEAASTHAKASRRRPSNPVREQFNAEEFGWFSKNAYNLAIKYCAEVPPQNLVQLLVACVEFIRLFQESDQSNKQDDLHLRLMFCHYLLSCAFVTLARAEDNMQYCIQYYLQVSKHGREFRNLGTEHIDTLSGSSKADMTAKHSQVVKLELESALKQEQWEELDNLFAACWEFGGPTHYDTLADLVLVIYSCMSKHSVDSKYQTKVLAALQKIINVSGKTTGFDIVKMSRWIRCLFQLALTYDETVSLKCVDHAIRIACARKGMPLSFDDYTPETPPPTSPPRASVDLDATMTDDCEKEPNHYPATELEWLATTSFNHAVDYYIQENDKSCKVWAEKALKLAEWAEEGSGLGRALIEKYNGLTWDEED